MLTFTAAVHVSFVVTQGKWIGRFIVCQYQYFPNQGKASTEKKGRQTRKKLAKGTAL